VVGRKQLQRETELTKKDPLPMEEEEEEVPLEEEGESQQTVKLREKAFSPTIGAAAAQVSKFGGCFTDNCSSFSMHTDITHVQNKVGGMCMCDIPSL